jgi:uncharacterized damage-inducible protein DinB
MSEFLADARLEFQRHKNLVDRAVAQLDDQQFFARPGPEVNPVALIVKHLAGNLLSRWTDFLTSDGEKPSRDRDAEFILTERDTRASLSAAWAKGWEALFETLAALKETDLARSITIRGESHTAQQALLRGMTHVAYHTGQILYLARLLRPDSPWLSIPPGQSRTFQANYRKG